MTWFEYQLALVAMLVTTVLGTLLIRTAGHRAEMRIRRAHLGRDRLGVESAAERARPEGGTSASTFPAEDRRRGRDASRT